MAADEYTQEHTINPRWIGFFAALWVLLIALAQIKTLTALVVAFAWLIAIAAIMVIVDPNNPSSILRKVGL